MSYSLWAESCQSCTENLTGMPVLYARTLTWAGLLFGLLLSLSSVFTIKYGKNYASAQAILLFASLVGGTLLFTGIAAGVYQPCPICKIFWATVGLSVMVGISSGLPAFRLFLPFMGVAAGAVAITKFDPTTAMTIASVLPQVPISKACDPSVLTKELILKLTNGSESKSHFLVVTRCSPCALASMLRLATKNPSWKLVVPDGKLDSTLKARDSLKLPEICEAVARGTKANLVLLTIDQGVVLGCDPNIEMNK